MHSSTIPSLKNYQLSKNLSDEPTSVETNVKPVISPAAFTKESARRAANFLNYAHAPEVKSKHPNEPSFQCKWEISSTSEIEVQCRAPGSDLKSGITNIVYGSNVKKALTASYDETAKTMGFYEDFIKEFKENLCILPCRENTFLFFDNLLFLSKLLELEKEAVKAIFPGSVFTHRPRGIPLRVAVNIIAPFLSLDEIVTLAFVKKEGAGKLRKGPIFFVPAPKKLEKPKQKESKSNSEGCVIS